MVFGSGRWSLFISNIYLLVYYFDILLFDIIVVIIFYFTLVIDCNEIWPVFGQGGIGQQNKNNIF